MLIAAESLADHSTEVRPTNELKMVRNRLNPTFSSTGELHRGNTHPHRLINRVHVKVRMGLGNPQLGSSAIELWEMHLG